MASWYSWTCHHKNLPQQPMTITLTTLNWGNIDHIMPYAIGPGFGAWNHVRHNHHLTQRLDLGRRLTRSRQDFYSYDGYQVTNWIPRRIQRTAYTIHAYLLLHTTTRAHPIYDFIPLLRTRWYNLKSNTPTNIPIPKQCRCTMYFATFSDSDHAINPKMWLQSN